MEKIILAFLLVNCSGGFKVSKMEDKSKYPSIISFEGEFSKMIERLNVEKNASKMDVWYEEVESKHQNYYNDAIFKSSKDKGWQSKRKKSLNRFFEKYDDIAKDTLKEFNIASETIKRKMPAFFEAFPDADFRGQEIYLVPSLFKFNGQGTTYKGQPILSFGVDFIVLLEKFPTLIPGINSSYNPDVFYIHEIFHLYHAKHFKKDMKAEKNMLVAVWEEGIASYVSEALAQKSTVSEVLMDDNLANCLKDKEFYIKNFKTDMYKTDDGTYKKWFLISSTDKEIPKRAGYCVGYLFAKDLSQKYSLSELAKLSWKEVHNEAKTFF